MKQLFYTTAFMMAFFSASSPGAPWQSSCAPANIRMAEQLFDQDRLIEADGAFSALEAECTLSPSDLMKWMRVKSVLAQFSEVGKVACLVLLRQPDAAFLVQDQLIDLVKEAGGDTIRSVLKGFCSCALSTRNQDTAAVRQWVAGVYNRFKLFDEEADALLTLDSKNYPSGGDLFAGVQRRFLQKLFVPAIQLGVPAYARLKDEARKSECALLLYQAYEQTGKNDSAGLWLKKVRCARPDEKAMLIVFCQKAGLASRADSLLSTLPPSLLRDTLGLRQKLFSGDFQGASAAASRLLAANRSGPGKNEFLLWRIRSLMFGGNGVEAAQLMDSVVFFPAMNGAEEFLSNKYRFALLNKAPQAWSVFAPVAFAAWLKRPDMALAALGGGRLDACPPDIRQVIVLDGVRTIMEGRQYADARAVMERTGFSSADAEFRYYYAEILYNVGAVDSARTVLQQMLLMQPGDVFSEKARIFLVRMNAQREGGRHGNTVDEKRNR
jgi:hypothetical protein